jgi:PIN domain nuclease of toxin-antitoxin system
MRYLLDTHVLVWWFLGDARLPAHYASAMQAELAVGSPLALSPISLWEIAKLVERGKMTLTVSVDQLLDQVESHPAIVLVPLSARIAVESTRLGPTFPRDPADQLIAASARCHGLTLLTADDPIRTSGVVPVA